MIMDEVNAMSFPNDFEEFIDDYSFIDKDEVYTNGSQLIPTFRVMQGYEHFVKQIRADAIEELADYIKKHFRIGLNTIDDVVREFKEQRMTDELKQWEYDRGYDKGRADMFKEILSELRNFICSDNRGSCDYFIVDQIESYMFALAEQMQKGADIDG